MESFWLKTVLVLSVLCCFIFLFCPYLSKGNLDMTHLLRQDASSSSKGNYPKQRTLVKRNSAKFKSGLIVVGCYSHERYEDFKWFVFPKKDKDQFEAWVEAVKIANERTGFEWNLQGGKSAKEFTRCPRICSAHFLSGDKSWNKEAINYKPTIFPDNPHRNKYGSKKRKRMEDQKVYPEVCDKVNRVTRGSQGKFFRALEDTDVPDTAIDLLSQLWLEDSSKDLTFICSGGEVVKCHSSIFALVNAYTKSLLNSSEPNVNITLQLPWCPRLVVEHFLKIVYCVPNAHTYNDLTNFGELVLALKVEGVLAKSDGSVTQTSFGKCAARNRVKQQTDKYMPGSVTFVRKSKDFCPVEPTLNTAQEPKEDEFIFVKGVKLSCKNDMKVPKNDMYIGLDPRAEVKKESQDLFPCDICHKYYKTAASLQGHMKCHMDPNPDSLSCDECPEKFETSMDRITHQRVIHQKHIVQKKCNACYEVDEPGHSCKQQYICMVGCV